MSNEKRFKHFAATTAGLETRSCLGVPTNGAVVGGGGTETLEQEVRAGTTGLKEGNGGGHHPVEGAARAENYGGHRR